MRSSGDDYSALAGGYDDDDNDDDDADGRADAASDEGLGMVLVNVVPVNELATPRLSNFAHAACRDRSVSVCFFLLLPNTAPNAIRERLHLMVGAKTHPLRA